MGFPLGPLCRLSHFMNREFSFYSQNNFNQILEEFIQSPSIDDQGRPIQPTQEELMDMWIKAVGGVHKGRVYGLGSEFSLSHHTSGLCGSYFSSHCSFDVDEFEQLNRKVAITPQTRGARPALNRENPAEQAC
uniref:Uncharacterized protein n=1 Tax=Nicotiana tabacum TaxID=4097 RepID=A0A1S4BIM5_TOBAC|nr:uncharacterized protein LOC104084963 [Nicotiana tomentosiformis]XP_016488719.1 PREDICTED: uncharacterized protein LOC107808693 [Nicotiana tabacum]